jgi:two-component system, chemotaxis family, response regulator Rcp1
MPNSGAFAKFASTREIEILIVESNPAEVLLISEALKAAGIAGGVYTTTDLDNALLYLRRLGKYAKVSRPDLIFLDLSLPETDGLDVLKEIKSTPSLVHIAIIVASGSLEPKLVRAVYKLNGNCFIRKPNELGELLRFITTCCEFWGSVVTLSSKAAELHKIA